MGLSGIPHPEILGFKFTSHAAFLLLITFFCIVAFFISHRIATSPAGRVLKAIREDEIFALACGKNVAGYKVAVLVVGAGMAATAGTFYATYITFIDPSSFTVMESIFILSIVIIGGAGSLWGPVIGAIVLVSLPELLRFVGLPGAMAANIRQMLYGSLLVIFMFWRPQGFIGEYAFKKEESTR